MILTFDDIITAEEHAKILDHVEKGTFIDGKATAYVCEDYVCRLPTTEPTVMGRLLDGLPASPD